MVLKKVLRWSSSGNVDRRSVTHGSVVLRSVRFLQKPSIVSVKMCRQRITAFHKDRTALMKRKVRSRCCL